MRHYSAGRLQKGNHKLVGYVVSFFALAFTVVPLAGGH